MRILDLSLAHHPLTITEWRAALWGDYQPKSEAEMSHGSPLELRHAEHKWEEYNRVVRLLSRVAQLCSYNMFKPVSYKGREVAPQTLLEDMTLRCCILWESSEINFQCEVMALDTVLVQNDNWLEIHRWQREAAVSAIWGPPSSVVLVIPRLDDTQDVQFRWDDSPDDIAAQDMLQHFCQILAQWPDCPDSVAEKGSRGTQGQDFRSLQQVAVEFYVHTFVSTFHHLPIAPVRYLRLPM